MSWAEVQKVKESIGTSMETYINDDPKMTLNNYMKVNQLTNAIINFMDNVEITFEDYADFLGASKNLKAEELTDPNSGYMKILKQKGFHDFVEVIKLEIPSDYLADTNYWCVFEEQGFEKFNNAIVKNMSIEDLSDADYLQFLQTVGTDLFCETLIGGVDIDMVVHPTGDYATIYEYCGYRSLILVLEHDLDTQALLNPTGDYYGISQETDLATLIEVVAAGIPTQELLYPTGDYATIKQKAGLATLIMVRLRDYDTQVILDPVHHFTTLGSTSHTAISTISTSEWTSLIKVDGPGIFWGAYNHTWYDYTSNSATLTYQLVFDGEVVDQFTIQRNSYDHTNMWGHDDGTGSKKIYIPSEQTWSTLKQPSPTGRNIGDSGNLTEMGYCKPFMKSFELRTKRSGTAASSDSIYQFRVGATLFTES